MEPVNKEKDEEPADEASLEEQLKPQRAQSLRSSAKVIKSSRSESKEDPEVLRPGEENPGAAPWFWLYVVSRRRSEDSRQKKR